MDTARKIHHTKHEAEGAASNACSKWAYENRAHINHQYSEWSSKFIATTPTKVFTASTYKETCNACGGENWKIHLEVKDK